MRFDGNRFLKARQRAQKTRNAIAEALEVSRDLVVAWEKNWVKPSKYDIQAICDFLECEREALGSIGKGAEYAARRCAQN